MEASAMGTPCVVTNVKGNREAVVHERNGIMVPLGDMRTLTAAMLRILRERNTAQRMGSEARRIAAERFYEQLVFQGSRPSTGVFCARKAWRFLSHARPGHSNTSVNRQAMKRHSQPGKRLFDLALALPALVLLSPLIAVAAVLAAIGVGWPILFRQQRPGLFGQPFILIKFRTMTDARNADGKLKPDVERTPPIGRFLRMTSLDELPELWNVVRGEMSLVGPRPLLMEYLPYYTTVQNQRHSVLPGITGLAQINGRNLAAFSERLKLDLWYVDHWSLWLDIKILARTLVTVLRSSGVKLEQPLEVDDVGLHPETRKKAKAKL